MNTEREPQAQVERWAEWIESRGLAPVALSLLDVGGPFGFLVAQALLVAEPFLTDVSGERLEQTDRLLRNRHLQRQLKGRLTSKQGSHE